MNKYIILFLLINSTFYIHSQKISEDGSVDLGIVLNMNPLELAEKLKKHFYYWYATPYKLGGNDIYGIDCSNFTRFFYRDELGKIIPRITTDQYNKITKKDTNNLIMGDLVFFSLDRAKPNEVSHVGLYIGKGYFMHASTNKGGTYNSLSENYYKNSYVGGGTPLF